jgi:hypothetical protein
VDRSIELRRSAENIKKSADRALRALAQAEVILEEREDREQRRQKRRANRDKTTN